MNTSRMNRRHRAGLFLTVIGAGLSLVLGATAKETIGTVLLSLAATWLVGSLNSQSAGLILSAVTTLAGFLIATTPILNDWKYSQHHSQDYNHAISDLQRAVDSALFQYEEVEKKQPILDPDFIPDPTGNLQDNNGQIIGIVTVNLPASTLAFEKPGARFPDLAQATLEPIEALASVKHEILDAYYSYHSPDDFRAYIEMEPISDQVKTALVNARESDAWFVENWPARNSEIKAQRRLEPSATGVMPDSSSFVYTRLYFREGFKAEQIVNAIRRDLLRPEPEFSLRTSATSHSLGSLTGLALFAGGLFGLATNVVRWSKNKRPSDRVKSPVIG